MQAFHKLTGKVRGCHSPEKKEIGSNDFCSLMVSIMLLSEYLIASSMCGSVDKWASLSPVVDFHSHVLIFVKM